MNGNPVPYDVAMRLKDTELNSTFTDNRGAYCTKDHEYSTGYPGYREHSFKEGDRKNPDVLKHKVYAPKKYTVTEWLKNQGIFIVVFPYIKNYQVMYQSQIYELENPETEKIQLTCVAMYLRKESEDEALDTAIRKSLLILGL